MLSSSGNSMSRAWQICSGDQRSAELARDEVAQRPFLGELGILGARPALRPCPLGVVRPVDAVDRAGVDLTLDRGGRTAQCPSDRAQRAALTAYVGDQLPLGHG